ncbi:MAG: HipA domain-containing protein, partial [Vicinamibacteria bacterium]
LPVVEIDLVEIGGQSCSLTRRYDRYTDEGGEVQRLHQEDFCQALGYPPDKKYQDSGGPSFADCFSALRESSTDPALDTRNLLRWQAFNVFAGNSDGHAKNLSILRLEKGVTRLAPFYDLVCTRAIERIDHRLACDVGGERDPGRISASHWDRLASQCDIREQFLRGLVEETATSLLEKLPTAKESFEKRFRPYPAIQRVESVIRKQCRRALSA